METKDLKAKLALGRCTRWWLVGSIIAIAVILSVKPWLWPSDVWGIKGGTTVTETVETDKNGNVKTNIRTTKPEPDKTIWDGLSLLGVPLTLAVLGVIFQQKQQKRSEDLAQQQRDRDAEIARQQREQAAEETNEEVLQVYIDRLSTLLVDKNLLAIAVKERRIPEEIALLDPAVDVMRARTLSILRRFEKDTKRKNDVIRFLLEADIISKLKLNLSGADLRGADLSNTDLRGANLSNADLSDANLSNADLRGAKLSKAKLSKADLSGADLRAYCRDYSLDYGNHVKYLKTKLSQDNYRNARDAGIYPEEFRDYFIDYLVDNELTYSDFRADLSGANLSDAILIDADLSDADLSDADLSGANLSGANLSGGTNLFMVKNLTNKQIKTTFQWDKAIYTEAVWDNAQYKWMPKDSVKNKKKIDEIKNDKASNPKNPPICN